MARESKQRKAKESIALVVDGKDEKWYFERVKAHYPCNVLKTTKIKPELPERKKVQELFDFAKNKLIEGYTFVVLIIDMDELLKDSREFAKFKELYIKYNLARENKLVGRQKTSYDWMKKILVIINNPCLEYWYLLHYRKTTKFYPDYSSLYQELRRIPEFSQYEKCEAYYNNHPDIYERLEKNNGLENAKKNAIPFDPDLCDSQGCSEMNLIFEYFDRL